MIAAGNDNLDTGAPNYAYPAHFVNDLAEEFLVCILTVCSVGPGGVQSTFSSFGNEVNVAAPGELQNVTF